MGTKRKINGEEAPDGDFIAIIIGACSLCNGDVVLLPMEEVIVCKCCGAKASGKGYVISMEPANVH